MKRLTLDETWVLCLQMWKWIAGQAKEGDLKVEFLKIQWLETHNYKDEELRSNCFFCNYAYKKSTISTCAYCPARKIDRQFSCEDSDYDYYEFPLPFYAKLVSLNKKRLSKKRKKKR